MRVLGSPLFESGRLVATPGALMALEESQVGVWTYLSRHLSGDWGEVDAEDCRANNREWKEGTRLLSAYHLPTGVKVWIITEADRSATTFLLPEEY